MIKNKILIIEDNRFYLDFLVRECVKDYEVLYAVSLKSALNFLKEAPDIVLLDLRVPIKDGKEPENIGRAAIKKIKETNPDIEIIILTGTTDKIRDAVECMKLGAYDFLQKEEEGLREKLKNSISNAIGKQKLKTQNLAMLSREKRIAEKQRLSYQVVRNPQLKYYFDTLVGESTVLKNIYQEIANITQRTLDSAVLITGEAGTGKEVIAAVIHFHTQIRSIKPFVCVNISSIPSELLETELFGIEKKTESDYIYQIGYFEQANGSTLFVDEIAEIPMSLQAKILLIIEEKKIQRVGAKERIPIDLRFIGATCKNLKKEVEKGNFREDLYNKLNAQIINLPPLKGRKDDITDLVDHFLFKFKLQNKGNENVYVTLEGMELLKSLDWPGNVQQLKNVIERAVVWRESNRIDELLLMEAYKAENRQFENSNILPNWNSLKLLHKKFTDIADSNLQLGIFIREFIESEGNIQVLKSNLYIYSNTANRLLKLGIKLIFIELCMHNSNIELLAKKWNVDNIKLKNAIFKASRLKRFIENSLKEYKDITAWANDIDISEKYIKKTIDYLHN